MLTHMNPGNSYLYQNVNTWNRIVLFEELMSLIQIPTQIDNVIGIKSKKKGDNVAGPQTGSDSDWLWRKFIEF